MKEKNEIRKEHFDHNLNWNITLTHKYGDYYKFRVGDIIIYDGSNDWDKTWFLVNDKRYYFDGLLDLLTRYNVITRIP